MTFFDLRENQKDFFREVLLFILCFGILASSTQTKKMGLTSSAKKIEKIDDKRSADMDSTLPSQLICLPRHTGVCFGLVRFT